MLFVRRLTARIRLAGIAAAEHGTRLDRRRPSNLLFTARCMCLLADSLNEGPNFQHPAC